MGSKPAGSKATWRGADEMRPLSTLDLAQARSLVTTLAGDTVTALWCSPSVRCRQSLEPLAAALALPVRTTARLSKTAHPRRLLTWLQEVGVDASWVVCTHGEVITALYAAARHAEIVGLAAPHPDREGRGVAAGHRLRLPVQACPPRLHPAVAPALTSLLRLVSASKRGIMCPDQPHGWCASWVEVMSMMRVLIVEDEPALAEPLAFLLSRDGFDTVIAGDGPTALAELGEHRADLVLLDLMLPGMSGIDVCTRIRANSRVPIIMVTARDTELDRVLGLELGADDFVTKPYSARELIVRIRTILRRTAPPSTPAAQGPKILTAGALTMDTEGHQVTVDGHDLTLPLREFELLEYLMRNAGCVLTRHQLIDRVWGADYVGDTKTLDVHVKRLRSKIEPDKTAATRLVTVRGLGYQLKS